MNANYKKPVPLSLLFICASFVCSMAACDKSEKPAMGEPLVTPSAQSEPTTQTIRVNADGISSSYSASYDGEQLTEIHEERSSAKGTAQGHYEFQGARLVRYRGAAFQDARTLTAEFNLEGRLVEARKGEREAPEEEIVQLRRRAQLLRSHALAQRASKMHTANH
jgi:hypothetical protein